MNSNYRIFYIASSILAAWIIFLMYQYKDLFGGDPEIHLIFAKNLIAGNWFEFNPGIKSGGETSPLFMVIVSFYLLIAGDYAQYLMKATGVISLAITAILIYKATSNTVRNNRIFLCLIFASMTFIQYQSLRGMENFLFAALITYVIHRYYSNNPPANFFLPPIVASLYLLRPEGVFLAVWLFLRALLKKDKQLLIAALISIVLILVIYKSLNLFLGIESHSAGAIRALTSKWSATEINFGNFSLYLSKKPLIAFLYALPIFLLIFLKRKSFDKTDMVTLAVFVALPIFLHVLNILPNTHVSRYVLYCYTILFYVFSAKILKNVKMTHLLLVGAWILMVSCFDFNARKSLSFSPSISVSIKELKTSFVKDNSQRLYEALQTGETPIIIALEEIQYRGRLDERFLVWSLDGITDEHLSKFVHEDYIDHFGYIKYRKVQYISGGLPNYNLNKNRVSLANFSFDNGNQSQCLKGIFLTKTIINRIYKVNYC